MIDPELGPSFERSNETHELWQGQVEALSALDSAHAQNIDRVYVHMVTGTDKTMVVAEDVAALRAKFNIPDVDSRNTGEFRAIGESQWKYYAARIHNGDERLKERVLGACSHKMLNLAKAYPEQNGLTIEDYFMTAYEGYLEAMNEGYPTADKETYLGHLNGGARTAITELIERSALLSGSMSPYVFGDKKSAEFIDPTPVVEGGGKMADIPDPSIGPYEQVAFSMLREELEKTLTVLKPRDLKVVEMRKGIHAEELATLDEVAKEVGITRERVRQIERKSLKFLARQSTAQQVIALDERLQRYYRAYEGIYSHQGHRKLFEERQIRIVNSIISVFFDGEHQ